MDLNQLCNFKAWCIYVEPLEGESISHFLGRFERANEWTAYQIGKTAGIGAILSRWKKLHFNPFPSQGDLEALAEIVEVNANRLLEMLPQQGHTSQPRPIKLCGACYNEVPCHRVEWQYKSLTELIGCDRHQLRLLSKCPQCKTPFPVPAFWIDGKCEKCSLLYSTMARFQKPLPQSN